MDFAIEKSFIGTIKAEFETIFGKNADENLNEFLMYLTNTTNHKLWTELKKFNNHIDDIKEGGYFDKSL